MIPLLGSNKRLCDGISRRDLLHVGGLGCFGVGMTDFLRWESKAFAAEAGPSPEITANFGKAKACILLFLFGSPPQHETFDPKPEAPVEVQGEMKAIPTSVPGLDICEGLPKSARIMDRCTVIRSMTHPYPLHGVAYALTGMPTYTPEIEAKPRDPQHWPFLGSIVDYLERPTGSTQGAARSTLGAGANGVAGAGRQTARGSSDQGTLAAQSRSQGAIPRNMGLPWLMGAKCDLAPLAGPYAAFLGNTYDPVWTDFDGKGTGVVPKLSDGQTLDVLDPFGGCDPAGKFRLSATTPLPDVSTGRFELRQSLLSQFDDRRRWLDAHSGISTWADHRQSAYSMLSAGRIRDALDVHQEAPPMRDRYGMTLFGQSCLAARRLVEAGGRFVSVFWDPYGPFGGSCWDTHANHYPRLKDYLLPVFDQSFTALVTDLEERGLLDETLILVLSEHGRTPKIDSKPRGAARHHWSRAYSAVMAGGGTARGRVVGRTDESGGDVASTPVSPKDVLATSLHLLGINPHATIPDRLGRPVVAAGDGIVRTEVL